MELLFVWIHVGFYVYYINKHCGCVRKSFKSINMAKYADPNLETNSHIIIIIILPNEFKLWDYEGACKTSKELYLCLFWIETKTQISLIREKWVWIAWVRFPGTLLWVYIKKDFQVLSYWLHKKRFPCTESQKTHFLENKYKLLKELQNPFYIFPSVSYDFSHKPNNLYILISKKTWNARKEKRKKKRGY